MDAVYLQLMEHWQLNDGDVLREENEPNWQYKQRPTRTKADSHLRQKLSRLLKLKQRKHFDKTL